MHRFVNPFSNLYTGVRFPPPPQFLIERRNMNKEDEGNELHELIHVSPRNLRTYYVTLVWFTEDTMNNLFKGQVVDFPDDTELVSTKYEVEAMTIMDAISQAKLIDSARKMELLTGFHQVINMASKEDKLDRYDYETVESFREYLIDQGAFTDFFFNDPTSISAYLKDNEVTVRDKVINNVMEDADSIGDNVENWLNNHDNKEDKDS